MTNLSPEDWNRLFGRLGISLNAERDPTHSSISIRVRSARRDAPLPTRADGTPYTAGEVVAGEEAWRYWALDPLLLLQAREIGSDAAWQAASLDSVGRTVATSLGTTLHAGRNEVSLLSLCPDVDQALLDTTFASLSDLQHWGASTMAWSAVCMRRVTSR